MCTIQLTRCSGGFIAERFASCPLKTSHTYPHYQISSGWGSYLRLVKGSLWNDPAVILSSVISIWYLDDAWVILRQFLCENSLNFQKKIGNLTSSFGWFRRIPPDIHCYSGVGAQKRFSHLSNNRKSRQGTTQTRIKIEETKRSRLQDNPHSEYITRPNMSVRYSSARKCGCTLRKSDRNCSTWQSHWSARFLRRFDQTTNSIQMYDSTHIERCRTIDLQVT